MSSPKIPELLCPAGSFTHMRYAFAYGADAVYAGQPRYSLRVRNNHFDSNNLPDAIAEAHALDKRFYLVSNVIAHNTKVDTFLKDMHVVIESKPDALIMSDPGLIAMVRSNFPDMPIHLSVQANVVNYASVAFWKMAGIERIILSRELSLDEIKAIIDQSSDIELEVFVHGALCMAYSGRCLLSGYLNKRDSNQGACTNACRWKYRVHDATTDEVGHLEKPEKPAVLLEETERPGELMEAFEDESGTYIMNSKDLCALEHVPRLMDIGLDCLKIEGRTKSYFYVARTAQAYSQAILDHAQGLPPNPELQQQLNDLANRGYTDGFLQRHRPEEHQNYETNHSTFQTKRFVGTFTGEIHEDGFADITANNQFSLGDTVEIMTPQGNLMTKIIEMRSRPHQTPMTCAKGSGYEVSVRFQDPAPSDLTYALLLRSSASD